MLLWGFALTWFIADVSRPCLFRLGEQRLGTFGSLPVRGGSGSVKGCLPLVP